MTLILCGLFYSFLVALGVNRDFGRITVAPVATSNSQGSANSGGIGGLGGTHGKH
jgi:hypothetical protein